MENRHPALIGVSGHPSTAKIDWLSLTFKKPNGRLYPSKLTTDALPHTPVRGYDSAVLYGDGRRECWHSTREDMGTHIVFSGQSLNTIADNQAISGIDLVRWYAQMDCKPTRIDIAADLHNSEINIPYLYQLWGKGECRTKARTATLLRSMGETSGVTLYIGSRSSEAFLRIYDKAVETGTVGDWIRVECEYKGSKAQEIVNVLASSENWEIEIVSRLLGQADFPTYSNWMKALAEHPIETPRAKDTTANTLKWLIKIVAPTLARHVALGKDTWLVWFMDEYRMRLKQFQDEMRQQ